MDIGNVIQVTQLPLEKQLLQESGEVDVKLGWGLVLLLAGCEAAISPPAADRGGLAGIAHPISVVRAGGEYDSTGPLAPVSMTQTGDRDFLLTNYRNVYRFDVDAGTVRPVRFEGEVPIWNPTAVTYSPYFDQVFIANYTGNDILVAEYVDGALSLVERVVHPEGVVGAEGIAVSNGGGFMAVASYDGWSVSLFAREAGEWVYRWTANDVVAAHGIAIHEDAVYAGGFGLLVKLDLSTGAELGRITRIEEDEILFATCVDSDEATGDLLVSDTAAGRLFRVDENLELVSAFASNGPTYANLSMPYCAYADGERTWVLSTYQDRILEIEGEQVISHELNPAAWEWADDLPQWQYGPAMWLARERTDGPSVALMGDRVRASYGRLIGESGAQYLLPSQNGDYSGGWLSYVSTVASSGDWTIVAANSTPGVLLFNSVTGELGFTNTDEWDCWALSDRLACPSGERSIASLVEAARITTPDTAPAMAQELTSEGGLRLKAVIEANGDVPAAAAEYLLWARGKPVPIVEFWVARSLAG